MLNFEVFKGNTPALALADTVGFLLKLGHDPLDVVCHKVRSQTSEWWEVTVYYKKTE